MNILFVDHSFHKKTKSVDFLVKEIEKAGTVVVAYDESWNGGLAVDNSLLYRPSWDLVIFFQILPNEDQLRAIPNNKLVLIPMYDNNDDQPLSFWLRYRQCKFLLFSATMHRMLKPFGFDLFLLRYFTPPKAKSVATSTPSRAFFWERTSFLRSEKVISYLAEIPNLSIHIHQALDPGHYPIQIDTTKFPGIDITTSSWFEDKSQLDNLIERADIYIAPRRLEGIGMSFLEAMACGKVVVANNKPTMSEYIVSGRNGILVDWEQPSRFDTGLDLKKIAASAYETALQGYEDYLAALPMLLEWLQSSRRPAKLSATLLRISYTASMAVATIFLKILRLPARTLKFVLRIMLK